MEMKTLGSLTNDGANAPFLTLRMMICTLPLLKKSGKPFCLIVISGSKNSFSGQNEVIVCAVPNDS